MRARTSMGATVAVLAGLLGGCSSNDKPPLPVDEVGAPGKLRDGGTVGKGGSGSGSAGGSDVDGVASGNLAEARRPHLQWKRYASFEADLASALVFTPDELCTEFGTEPCIRRVHLVPLGGHEPFVTGMLEPAPEPLATTPTVVERVILNACSKRVELDREAGQAEAKVFSQLDLTAASPGPDDTRVRDLSTALYRRLLARDPDANELTVVGDLTLDDAGQPIAAADFAKLACFVIGTSSEFLFF